MIKKTKKTSKHPTTRRHKKLFLLGEAKNGALYAVAAVAAIGFFGTALAGGAIPEITKLGAPPPGKAAYSCCDSGDGPDCHPILEKQFTFRGQIYALLKSNIVQKELVHVKPANIAYGGPDQYTPWGQRIFVNTSASTAHHPDIPGCQPGKELVRINPSGSPTGRNCFGIPEGEIIYVCTDTAANCHMNINPKSTPFDAYYRIADGPVPSPLTNGCIKPSIATNATPQNIIGVVTPGGRKNLQLETFQVQQQQQQSQFLNAWCKPAINLYPTQKATIHVQVAPQGKLLTTTPAYPQTGWDVTAAPDGTITQGNQTFPYLYWEASLPDALITQPKDGYVVAYNQLANLFQTILPQLGLNQREQDQFQSYWLKALPASPYYFVGVVPQSQINDLAPLTISPTPDSLLRVTLYFKALTDNSLQVQAPQLPSFTRHGFTATEWGGFFKADKNHKNFTCLM
jgi:hypothetical protein